MVAKYALVVAAGLAIVIGPAVAPAAPSNGGDVPSPLAVSSVFAGSGGDIPAADANLTHYRVMYRRPGGKWVKYQDFTDIQQANALAAWIKQRYPTLEVDVWVVH
jgi:hypothetical protein